MGEGQLGNVTMFQMELRCTGCIQNSFKNSTNTLQNSLQLTTIGLQLAFNSKGFKKVYHISEPHPGPDLKEAQTKSEAHFNTIISSQKKVAKKIRKAFEDDDD